MNSSLSNNKNKTYIYTTSNWNSFVPYDITHVIISSEVPYLKDKAFEDRYSICSVKFENDSIATRIGKNAFSCNWKLERIIFPSKLMTIDEDAFYSCRKLKYSSNDESEEFTFPLSLRRIGSRAFFDASSIVNIQIPPLLTKIDDYTFQFSKGLETVRFSSSIKEIGKEAFYGCVALHTLYDLPSSNVNVAKSAFFSCPNLKQQNYTAIRKPIQSIEEEKKKEDNSHNDEQEEDMIDSDSEEELDADDENVTNTTATTTTILRKGMTNLGNTCYLNASIQLLVSVPEFLYGLQQQKGGELCNSFTSLIINNKKKVINPRPMKGVMDKYTKQFRGTKQHDAHEFIGEFLDRIHDELVEKNPKSACQYITDSCFRTEVRVSLKCENCGYERSRKEFYRNLSIDAFLSSNNKANVEDGINSFFKSEELDVDCEKCNDGTTATQTSSITSLPKSMILHLKRWIDRKGHIYKNKAAIHTPDIIDFSKNLFEQQQQQTKYKLSGIIHHHGNTPYSGHYTADAVRSSIKNKDEAEEESTWYSYNDMNVTKLTTKLLNNSSKSSSYILLYNVIN